MTETRLEMRQTQKLSKNMQTVIRLLSLGLDGVSDFMLKAIQENPALEFVPAQKSPQDYAVQVKTRFRSRKGVDADDLPEPEDITDRTMDDLTQQVRLSNLPDDVCEAALKMLYMLTPRGYFVQELDEFAMEAGIPKQVAKDALRAIQNLEPTGIGARSVEECLTLQLQQKTGVDPLCYDLIRMYLLEIGKGNLRQIARETGATLKHINECVATIRSLSPMPCSLSGGAVQYIMPEFSVETADDGQLLIQFHNDYYPTFRQDSNFVKLADTLTGEAKTYARRMLTSAGQIIRALEMRQNTMEKVARIIVREQRAFFLGQYSLLPLRVDDVAREMGMHETTVYRAIEGKYLYCSRGTFPLNHFFQKEVGGSSQARVKEIIRKLCEENGRMSDREITERLEKCGIHLSRRTVDKYRSQMEIDSSFRRSADTQEDTSHEDQK